MGVPPQVNPEPSANHALKCLFLNRTTFSGILHKTAGPIGGKKQESAYTIGCRFNKTQLEQRLRLVGALAAAGGIVDVTNLDYEQLAVRLRTDLIRDTGDRVVVYLDPPYVEKAESLYEWSFEGEFEHDRLLNVLAGMRWRWILSYDDHPTIHARYNGLLKWHKRDQRISTFVVSNRYSAATESTRTSRRELLVTNLPVVPPDPSWTRL